MKTMLIGAGMLATTLVLPASALAATYQYVNVNGVLGTVIASDAPSAMIAAKDIAAHSGVILIEESSDVITNTTVANPNSGAM